MTVYSATSGNPISGVTLSGGDFATVSPGGVATDVTMDNDSVMTVFSGGVANFTILSGGFEYLSGGAASGGVVSGGTEAVFAGGTASFAAVSANGNDNIYSGGTAIGMMLSGGVEYVRSGGSATATVISGGGGEFVFSGATADGAIVRDGGTQTVNSGGTASGSMISSGGTVQIDAGGTVSAIAVGLGGVFDLPDLTFHSGGSAVLSGGGTLVVTEGIGSTILSLAGPYDSEAFQTAPETGGGTGTVVTLVEAPRTLVWTGASGADFANAANWNDLTNQASPAAVAPDAADTAEFLTGGGTIAGTGTAAALLFGGSGSWDLLSNTSLTAASAVTVGVGGVGSLLIGGGSSITGLGASGEISGGADGGAAQLTVAGLGSVWRSAGALIVGAGGIGELTVAGAAALSAAATQALPALVLGEDIGGAGSVLVTGAGSTVTLAGQLNVGEAGGGYLAIAAAGTVTTTAGDAGGSSGMVIAAAESASGSSVQVSGAGSDLGVAGLLAVGGGGFGSLSMSDGATVTAGSLDLASAASGDGVLSVVGTGTTLTVTGSVTVGDQSAGEMSILGGAAVTIGGGLDGGTGAGASGNIDVEGNGSQLTIAGGTLVVGASGPAVYTLGQGTTQTGTERTAQFGVANLGGLQDPPYITNDGAANLNSGFVGLADIGVLNSGTYTVKALSGTFAAAAVYAPDITFDANPADNGGSTTGLWVIQNLGTLVLNASTVDASQTFDFSGTNGAKLILGQTPAVSSSKDPDGAFITTGGIAQGSPNVLAGFAAPIQNYLAGDAIVLQGLAYGSATASGDVVTVWSGANGGGTTLGTLTFIDKGGSGISVAAKTEATLAATQLTTLACFAAGTSIETVSGLVRVEDLRIGDRAVTVVGESTVAAAADRDASATGERVGQRMAPAPARAGDAARADEPIVWLGVRAVHCATHPDPRTVWPVRVQAGAFGENVPRRDLYLSPDHAVFINNALIPVKLLINGTSITQVERDRITYHHVELREHAVILAEGLPVESYLDLGDRANFADAGQTTRPFPKLSPADAWEAMGAAPLVRTGEKLERANRAVTARQHLGRYPAPARKTITPELTGNIVA